VETLLTHHIDNMNAIRSPLFDLQGPGTQKPIPARLKVHASTTGLLSIYVELPAGTRAWYAQWVGPVAPKWRVAVDDWADIHWWGRHDAWVASEHAERGVVRVGLQLLFVVPPDGIFPESRFQLVTGAIGTLGSGSFGTVNLATDLGQEDKRRRDVAVKIASERPNDLLVEAGIMHRLSGELGFPELVGLYSRHGEHLLVMERLHRDLESLMRDPDVGRGRLSPDTVIEVGCQCLDRLRCMHSLGILHRDLKPDNMMIAGEGGRTIYLVDFGLSTPYLIQGHPAEPPKPRQQRSGVCGTVRYCSLFAHEGQHSRRSDVESLAFVLIYLAAGNLPWQGSKGSTKQKRYDIMHQMKRNIQLIERHTTCGLKESTLAGALLGIVRHCRTLTFEAEPDYAQLQSDLRKCASEAQRAGQDAADSQVCRLDWISPAGLTPAARNQRFTATSARNTTAAATCTGTVSRARAAESPAVSYDDAFGGLNSPSRTVQQEAFVSHTGITVLTLQQLQDEQVWRALNIPPDKREEYLCNAEFEAVFGMAKVSFDKLPRWKRQQKKKLQGLF